MKFALFFILIVTAGVFYVVKYQSDFFEQFYAVQEMGVVPEVSVQEIQEMSSDSIVAQIKKKISLPPPMRVFKEAPQTFLTQAGVLQWTNVHRASQGLAPLSESPQLNAAAATKLVDMFARQYFAHESPTGEGAATLAEFTGYEYIAIGENLALGNYKDDEELVRAWLDSPGHRKNIESSSYEEIGIGVGKDVFDGNTTWIAVQIFGRPLSACPSPSEELKGEIELAKSRAAAIDQDLASKREVIESYPEKGPAFNSRVREYNKLVAEYRVVQEEINVFVVQYNAQVVAFNACIQQ